MKLKIEDKIFEEYPGLYIGVIVVHGINNTGGDKDNPEGKLSVQ